MRDQFRKRPTFLSQFLKIFINSSLFHSEEYFKINIKPKYFIKMVLRYSSCDKMIHRH